ncbi:SFRP3-like protein [Mya arenaria]|uniref:SFRP3-like protein n=1 Tax=Mya arenaria TaxID=6604 RepID=A0ABY7E0P5_MYAAR|nr:secreted frizzled-related protein 3-like [Mya arenaria]WAR02408.1 SFRP3-like protein [Mya arenaria]
MLRVMEFCEITRTVDHPSSIRCKSDSQMFIRYGIRDPNCRAHGRRCFKKNTSLTLIRRPTFLATILCLIHLVTFAVTTDAHRGLDMCEPIEISMCSSMPYNMTRMPNHLHHSTQENARLAIEPYGELIKENCSADLLFFLCAMFAPICTPMFQKEAIPPCRSVCESSRHGCEPVMNQYNISWPTDLNCDRLPEYDKGVCVSPEAIVSSMPEGETPNEKSKEKGKEQTECSCNTRIKPNKKVFKKGKYDYAIGALIKHITPLGANATLIRVTVNSILLRGKVHLQERRDINLLAGSSCVCPALRTGRQYLIVSREDVMMNRLLFTEDSLISRWKTKWGTKFMRWVKEKRGKNKKRPCKNKKSKKCRRRKRRCRHQPKDESKAVRCARPGKNNTPNRKNRKKKKENVNTVTNEARK